MGIKLLYNDNLRKLPNEYGDVSVMLSKLDSVNIKACAKFGQNPFIHAIKDIERKPNSDFIQGP